MGIREIAAACGVSPSTVSRVLRGREPKCASEAVKQRIWQAARESGYRANQAARQLRCAAEPAGARRIGFLLGRAEDMDSHDFTRVIGRAAMAEALRLGLALAPAVSVVGDLRETARLQNADGVIMIGRRPDAVMKQLHRLFPHFIYIGSNPVNEGLDQVICSGYEAAEMAVSRMIYSGHVRIGYVGGQEMSQRYQAYRDTVHKHSLRINPHWVSRPEESADATVRRLLAMAEPPTAVLCDSDPSALSFIAAYQKLASVKIMPAIISIEDTRLAAECRPMLSAIHMPTEEMGALAAKLLLDRMNGGHREAVNVRFPCRYVERESFQMRLPT